MDTMSKKIPPSMDAWMQEAKSSFHADQAGMYLIHNGVVRKTAKAKARFGDQDAGDVISMEFSYDPQRVSSAIEATLRMDGISCVKVWLNEGHLQVGDDLMYVLVGGDIRPHVIEALQFLVETLKTTCVTEIEHTL